MILAAALPPGPLELGRMGYPLAADALGRILKEPVEMLGSSRPLSIVQPDRWLPPLPERDGHLDLGPFLPQIRAWLVGLTLPAWLDEVAAPLWQEVSPFPYPRLPAAVTRAKVWAFDREQAWHYLTVMPALHLEHDIPLPQALLAVREQAPSLPLEAAREHLSSDFLRLNLATEQLSLADLAERTETVWEDWLALVRDWTAHGPATGHEPEFQDELTRLAAQAEEHRQPTTFSLPRQVQVLDELALRGHRFAELHVHTDSAPALQLSRDALKLFARLVEPIMPDLAASLKAGTPYEFMSRANVAALVASRFQKG